RRGRGDRDGADDRRGRGDRDGEGGQAAESGPRPRDLGRPARTGEPAGAVDVRAAVRRGGAGADAFLDAVAERLALGVAAVSAVLDPGCVVLGGETGHAGGSALAVRVEARLAELSPLHTEVRASALGGAAVLRGALLTARDAAQDDLFGPTR
ncbi:ROK family protein, partial [Streptomyces sp. TRM64462]|uniref:ROK family protein n=1 Tax=Streptomyces sp. TRM64462 TaxID=2741726 RepID=UPI0015862B06